MALSWLLHHVLLLVTQQKSLAVQLLMRDSNWPLRAQHMCMPC